MKTLIKCFLVIIIGSVVLLSACSRPSGPNTIKMGTISGPETELMEVAKQVAKDRYGLTIEIIPFSSYPMPNAALNDGSIDANMFQHLPYLNAEKNARGYHIIPIGKTFIYPMAIYSKKMNSMAGLRKNAIVAIPNDPSNGARALLLLEKAGLIQLKPGVKQPSRLDISANPNKIVIKEMDAAQLPRILDDVTLAVINTNWAIPAGLLPKRDALFSEDKDSPYANIVVIRDKDKADTKFQRLMKALHSKEVLAKAKVLFKGQAIPAWK